MRRTLRLPEFIRKIGIPEFARRYSVTERAAESYMRRKRWPRRDVALRIVEGSPVSWEGIYGREPHERAAAANDDEKRRAA